MSALQIRAAMIPRVSGCSGSGGQKCRSDGLDPSGPAVPAQGLTPQLLPEVTALGIGLEEPRRLSRSSLDLHHFRLLPVVHPLPVDGPGPLLQVDVARGLK